MEVMGSHREPSAAISNEAPHNLEARFKLGAEFQPLGLSIAKLGRRQSALNAD